MEIYQEALDLWEAVAKDYKIQPLLANPPCTATSRR